MFCFVSPCRYNIMTRLFCASAQSDTGNGSLPCFFIECIWAVNWMWGCWKATPGLLETVGHSSFSPVSLWFISTHARTRTHTYKNKHTMATCSLLQTKTGFISVLGPGCFIHRTPERVWELLCVQVHLYSSATGLYINTSAPMRQWHTFIVGQMHWLILSQTCIDNKTLSVHVSVPPQPWHRKLANCVSAGFWSKTLII